MNISINILQKVDIFNWQQQSTIMMYELKHLCLM